MDCPCFYNLRLALAILLHFLSETPGRDTRAPAPPGVLPEKLDGDVRYAPYRLKNHTLFKTSVHKPYPISDQNGQNRYPISDQNG